MHNAAITGLPGPGRASRNAGVPTDENLVNPRFNRDKLNEPVLQRSLESKLKLAKEKYTAAPLWRRGAEKLLVGLSILFRIHHDGVIFINDADRTAEPKEMENTNRISE